MCADVHHTAAGNNTFLDSCTGSRECVVHAVFLLFHLHFAGSSDVELRYAACQFGKTLLQFLFVVSRFGSCNLCFDLSHAVSDSLFVASSIDDGCVVFIDCDRLGCSEHIQCSLLEFDTFLFADNRSAGEDSDVLQHLFAAVAEARSFDCTDLELRTQTVDNQCCQRFAVHVFRDDEQRTSALYGGFKNRQQLFEVGDFLVVDEDIRFIHLDLHRLGVGDEIRADVAAVELHTLYHVNRGVHTFGFADGDDAVFRHFAHRVGNEFADLGIVVSRNGSYLLNLVEVVANYYGVLLNLSYDGSHGFVNTAFEVERVGACSYVLQTHANDSLCQNGCGSGTITRLIACLGSHFLDELCTEVFGCVFQFNLFGYRYTVFGDMRSSVFLVDDDIAAFRTKCHFDSVSQLVNATLQSLTGFYVIGNIFCHNNYE